MVAWRRRGAFCKGIVSTARRGGLPFAPAKGSKTGSRGRFPLDEPPFVACSAGYERCKGIVRTAHRYAPKVAAGASAPTPSPSPVAGEGPSGQIAACSIHRLGSMTFCHRFAVTKIKCAAGTLRAYLRRRTDDAFASFVSRRSLSVRGSWGTAPSVFCLLLHEQK